MTTYQPTTGRPADYSAADLALLERLLSGAPDPHWAAPPEWLTVEEIAAELGKSRSTVYKWSARGYPHFPKKAVQPCGSIRVRRGDLDAWLGERVR